MIDGLKVICKGLDPQQWRDVPTLEFFRSVSDLTGQKGKASEAKRYGLTFRIADAKDGTGKRCSITGSLHKHRNKGEDNSDLFTLADVITEVQQLPTLYGINLDTAVLTRLEIGLNVLMDYQPKRIIRQLVCHNRLPFSSMSTKNKMLGKIAERSEYTIKVYDKGRGERVTASKYVLRVEIRFNRMRTVKEKCGVETLADLLDVAKLDALATLLLDAMDDVILFDRTARPKGLTNRQRQRWVEYGNSTFWKELSRDGYYKQRRMFATLCEKGGVSNPCKKFTDMIENAAKKGRQYKPQKRRRLPQMTTPNKADEKATFGRLEYMLPNVAFERNENGDVCNHDNTAKNADTKRRFCKTCGREITEQDPRSIFCAERLYGKEAKKCRNADSNHRAAKRRIIERAMQRNKIIWVTYEVNGEKYTDELTPQELYLQREWVDRVCTVRIIDRPAVQGKEAQLLLWKLQEDAGGGSSTPPAMLTQPHGRPPQMSRPPSNNSRIATKEQPKCN